MIVLAIMIWGLRVARVPRLGMVTGVAVAVALGCAACRDTGGPSAQIPVHELVGTWSTPSGSTHLRLAADQSLSASGLTHALPLYGCPPNMAGGHWFLGAMDDPVDPGDAGSELTLEPGGDTASGCVLAAEVQRDGRGFNLCLVQDPDQTCTADELLRRSPDS